MEYFLIFLQLMPGCLLCLQQLISVAVRVEHYLTLSDTLFNFIWCRIINQVKLHQYNRKFVLRK